MAGKKGVNIVPKKLYHKVRLMACPFCGGEAMLHDEEGNVYRTNGMERKDLENKKVKTFCRCGVCRTQSDTYDTPWECTQAWNNRV